MNGKINKANIEALEQSFEKRIRELNMKTLDEINALFQESIKKIKSNRKEVMFYENKELMKVLKAIFALLLLDKKTYLLIKNLKRKDFDSYIHSFDVFIIGTSYGALMGVDDILSFAKGSLLHDIGKLKVPNNILKKEGRLTKEEFEVIENHSLWGKEILKDDNETVNELVTMHHEKQNGTGYPYHLKENNIPFNAQILSIVDVFSALSLKRSYKEVIEVKRCIEILAEGAEISFNSPLLFEFLALLSSSEKNETEIHHVTNILKQSIATSRTF